MAEFWGQEAAKLVAPLLHAAALAGSSIGEVIAWLDAQDDDAPVQLLGDGGDPAASTLYLAASSLHQRLLAPVIVALVSSVLEAAVETSRAQSAPLDPLLRVLLDETANCAPLQDLPAHLSQLAAHGVRIATVWQSLAQARDRYGEAIDTVMAASTCKLFMGPITDETTRR